MTGAAEAKVGDAIEQVAESQAQSAEAAKEAADASSKESIAKASADAATAAQAAATLAETHAAQTIQENEENTEWLRQHAAQTDTSFQNLNKRMESLEQGLPKALEAHRTQTVADLKTLLTPPALTQEEITSVTPEEKSAEEDARRKAEAKAAKASKSQRRRWL